MSEPNLKTEPKPVSEQDFVLYCANHPQVETSLRCSNCDKPICPKCAVRTPTGYRCRECVRGHQKIFDTAQWYDYPIAFITAVILSYVGGLIAPRFGFFVLFVAPIAGVIIAEVLRAFLRKRRSKRLFQLATAGVLVGVLPFLLIYLDRGNLLSLIWLGFYAFTAASTVYYRLSGISVSR
jgi:hypothetical protein